MKNIVIGTAGHIDHGKTSLIKKLTGTNTDILPEEQKRGITINIGFAYLDGEDSRIGIVDVPGHEKFIKNMVAGVKGIQYLLLVVACNDGIMQQTKEHFNICKLLGIKHGMIVLTKADLCTKTRINEVKNDLVEFCKGTFLEDSPICVTSLTDDNSFIDLKKTILNDIKRCELTENDTREFFLSIDRRFSSKGFGVVITGTSLNNTVSVGDYLTLYPKKISVKVKKIENHGNSVQTLLPNNRCALNLGGVQLEDINRGDVLSKNERLETTHRIDCYFQMLKSYKKLKNNSQVRLNIGTKEIITKVKIFGKNEMKAGEEGFIQLELKESIIAMENELGIIRSISPTTTIGGVRIIDVFGRETKRDNIDYLNRLKVKYSGNDIENVYLYLKEQNGEPVSYSMLNKKCFNITKSELLADINIKKILFEDKMYYIFNEDFNKKKLELEKYLLDSYEKNNLKMYIPKAEIKNQCFKQMKSFGFNIYMNELQTIEMLEIKDDKLMLKNYKTTLTKEQKVLKDELIKLYKSFGFNPLNKKQVLEKYKNKYETEKIFTYLVMKGLLIYLGDDAYLLSGFYKEAIKILKSWFENSNSLKLGEYRDELNTSRKIALLLLDRFDRLKITEKIDDYRVLRS